jgi:hypothetical protein
MVQYSIRNPFHETQTNLKVFWLLPAFLLTALSFGSTVAPKINLYSSLACEDYYSERSNLGLPGPLPGGAYPIIEIGQPNLDCHLPQVTPHLIGTYRRYKLERHSWHWQSIYVPGLYPPSRPESTAHYQIGAGVDS